VVVYVSARDAGESHCWKPLPALPQTTQSVHFTDAYVGVTVLSWMIC